MSTEPRTPEEQALAGLLRVRDRSIAFVYAVLRDFQAAEDVYQEAALTAHRRLAQFSGGSFENWFLTILRNVLGTHLRSTRRRPLLADSALIDRLSRVALEEDPRAPEENVDHVAECLKGIRGPLRRMLEQRFVENASCDALARQLGRSVQATYAMIKRTRQALRDCVELRMRGGRA